MTHAVFNADRKVLAQFTDGCGALDTTFLAHEALDTTYAHVADAFVDELCTRHMEPNSSCRTCLAQLLCGACNWPHTACAAHR